MKIKWYGTASLLIEEGGDRILIDPYLKRLNPKLPAVPVEEAAMCDAVFITHPHFDHFSDIGEFLKAGVPKVYVSLNGIAHARENGIPTEKMTPLSAGEEIAIGEFTVRTFQSRHCKFDLRTVLSVALNPVTYFRFRDSVNLIRATKRYKIKEDIYALEISSKGKKVMVLGSAGMDREGTSYPKHADLFVFPYQGRAGMHRYMIPFLEVFAPKKVMIDHFDDAFPPFTHAVDPKKFVPTVKKYLPECEALIPEVGNWYEI